MHGNGPESSEVNRSAVVKIIRKQHGSKRTETGKPLSGPRYRGSNPCLPASNSFNYNYLRRSTICAEHAVSGHVIGRRLDDAQPIETQ